MFKSVQVPQTSGKETTLPSEAVLNQLRYFAKDLGYANFPKNGVSWDITAAKSHSCGPPISQAPG